MAVILIWRAPVCNSILPGFQVQLVKQALIIKQDAGGKKVCELIDIILSDFALIVAKVHRASLGIGQVFPLGVECRRPLYTGLLPAPVIEDFPDKTPYAGKITNQRIFVFRNICHGLQTVSCGF